MKTYLLPAEETARRFLVSTRTLARWLEETARQPTKRAVGCLVRAVPPLRAYSHVVRDLVSTMDTLGFGGSKRIAQSLAAPRSGWAPKRCVAGARGDADQYRRTLLPEAS